jgi:hypothetical protein
MSHRFSKRKIMMGVALGLIVIALVVDVFHPFTKVSPKRSPRSLKLFKWNRRMCQSSANGSARSMAL